MEVKSGDKAKCGHCGYKGIVYGYAHAKGVYSPWCKKCKKNDKLTKLNELKTK